MLLLAGAKIRPEICPSPRGDECTQMRALLRSVLRGIFRLLMAVVLFPRIRTLQRLHADVVRLRKNLDDSCANLNALGAACDDLRIELERLRLPHFTVAQMRPDKDGLWIRFKSAEERAAAMRLFQIDRSAE